MQELSSPEYSQLSVWRGRHSRRRTSAVSLRISSSSCVSTVDATLLTCQKRAAAPIKPGELRTSFAIRLCDEVALAGMVKGSLLTTSHLGGVASTPHLQGTSTLLQGNLALAKCCANDTPIHHSFSGARPQHESYNVIFF
jgi:hypothetical protein